MKLIIDIPEDVYKKTVFYREFKDLNDCITTIKALENGIPLPKEPIPEQWQELKETITEMRDNDGTGTQQEVCKFLINYMVVLEKQMVELQESEDKK